MPGGGGPMEEKEPVQQAGICVAECCQLAAVDSPPCRLNGLCWAVC